MKIPFALVQPLSQSSLAILLHARPRHKKVEAFLGTHIYAYRIYRYIFDKLSRLN